MSEVRVVSINTVQAENHTIVNPRIDLTPWDLQLLLFGPIKNGLLFHKPPPSQQSNFISDLKTSLSRTLHFFPPLAGRLAAIIDEEDATTVTYYIDCNNAGVEFVCAAADGVAVADILTPLYVPSIVQSFFPWNGVRNYEGTSRSLMAVKVTELLDGVFIGCTMNHVVADGTSFWHFLNTWSEIARGCDSVSKPPLLRRWFYDETQKCPIGVPLVPEIKQEFDSPPLKRRVFHFTKENIAKLKAKANSDMCTNRISSLQALLAHLWRSVILNRPIDHNREVHFWIPIGARPRMRSQLPENYFGNAFDAGCVTLKAGEIVGHGLGYIALKMNEMVATFTEEKLKSKFKSWGENPQRATIESFARDALLLFSSQRFDVYGNNFGWGRPVAVHGGVIKGVEKVTVFCGVEEGSIDLEVCISAETLEALGNDPEFMNAVN